MYRIRFEDLPWQECAPGVRHKVVQRDQQLLRLVEYASGMPPHWCERGHVGQILEGTMEIEFASGTWTFEPGDGVDIPEGGAHRHRARILSEHVLAIFVERST